MNIRWVPQSKIFYYSIKCDQTSEILDLVSKRHWNQKIIIFSNLKAKQQEVIKPKNKDGPKDDKGKLLTDPQAKTN